MSTSPSNESASSDELGQSTSAPEVITEVTAATLPSSVCDSSEPVQTAASVSGEASPHEVDLVASSPLPALSGQQLVLRRCEYGLGAMMGDRLITWHELRALFLQMPSQSHTLHHPVSRAATQACEWSAEHGLIFYGPELVLPQYLPAYTAPPSYTSTESVKSLRTARNQA
ncbi:hypothetical protein BT69DRAFT_1276552 [Atractiella rhizophila]|nr:hypothetical protein BT69DRAFT_1276552 [Atractiella rhizophila]